MKSFTNWAAAGAVALAGAAWTAPLLAADDIVIGFATAESGWMVAYDQPSSRAALIRIDELNAAGGVLGRQLRPVFADTKTDRAQGAKAGASVLDEGAELVIVSCDYDFGAPAGLAAENAGKVSFFLCAEDVKAGIEGVGPHSFSASVLAAVQGATMAEWGYHKRGFRTAYVLLDTTIEYNKGICYGFDWMFPRLEGTKILGHDTFKNDDPSIASQITRIKNLPEPPDAIMLCTYVPGGASATRQLRAAGIDIPILNGSSMDGSYWLDAVPNLSNFIVPVQGSVHGDDPNPAVEVFNKTFEAKYDARPSSQYAYPGYVLIDVWAKAVERAGTTDADAVVAELEKFRDEPTMFGPRTFTSELHHQNQARYLIAEVTDGKFGIVDDWTISEPVPMSILFGN
jgi:branched-chain amino acid transport system substrate-binding protein